MSESESPHKPAQNSTRSTNPLLSPKQVAAAIGVSESSLKRWCDKGIVPIRRTPGGHRKIHIGDVFQFLRSGDRVLVRPELLGLPTGTGQAQRGGESAKNALVDSLGRGDFESSRRLVLDFYLSGCSIAVLCDSLLGPVMHSVGDNWECGEFEVYQEHRACEFLAKIVYELRHLVAIPEGPIALGGTPTGDHYRLATSMIELTLAEAGWRATSLGTSLPFATLSRAIERHRPRLCWLSMSHLNDEQGFGVEFADWLTNVPTQTSVVFGGRVADRNWATDDGRAVFCDDFTTLRELADSIAQTPADD